MLSRVADALYWMSRYVERAEQSARVLEVTRGVLLELREADPAQAGRQWAAMLAALGLPDISEDRIVFDEAEPASIVTSVSRARENARQVREVISSEMWQELNQAYWALREAAQAQERGAVLSQTLAEVIQASFSWSGITDATMRRGDGWLFVKLGQFIERAARTSRIVAAKAADLEPKSAGGDRAEDNFLLLTLLRCCSSLEAYRKVHPTRLDPQRVLEFIVLDREFPRTVRYSVSVAADFARRLGPHERGRPVERAFGKLAARIDYCDVEELSETGVATYLDHVVTELNEASMALQRTYFLH